MTLLINSSTLTIASDACKSMPPAALQQALFYQLDSSRVTSRYALTLLAIRT
jgi:hypothetical protein